MRKNIKKINNKTFNDKLKKIWQCGMFDPNGAYTGYAYDKQKPVQDQDDL